MVNVDHYCAVTAEAAGLNFVPQMVVQAVKDMGNVFTSPMLAHKYL